jgi:hypothetical protein
MIIKSGIIYFVREKQSDGGLSDLVKIGLVEGNRDPWERLGEHQTGNPRRLIFDEEQFVETPAVKFVERQLHREFAKYRVSGEWFDFSDKNLLIEAISKARGLALTMAPMVPMLEEANRLADVVSNGEILPYDDSLRGYFDALMIVKKKTSLMESLKKDIKKHFKEYVAREGIEGIKDLAVENLVHTPAEFNMNEFMSKEPELYSACLIEITGWPKKRPGFRLKAKADESALDQEFLEMYSEFQDNYNISVAVNDLYKLNDLAVELKRALSLIEWDDELNSSRLKVACGAFDGIENICSWKRPVVTITEFSKDKLIELNKEVYAKYLLPQPPTKQLRLIGYKA